MGGMDVTGDGHPDLMAVNGGRLVLYPGTGNREYSTTATTPIDLTGTDQAFVSATSTTTASPRSWPGRPRPATW